jgi:hypothetical protein
LRDRRLAAVQLKTCLLKTIAFGQQYESAQVFQRDSPIAQGGRLAIKHASSPH